MLPSTADKRRAKDIIVELVRQAGGQFQNKTNLFKAFYYAHLAYARDNPGYLSMWPIVRMPHGPGIDRFDELLGELLLDGRMGTEQLSAGDHQAFVFSLTDVERSGSSALPLPTTNAINEGVAKVKGRPAASVSEESHQRSWANTRNGEEMDIYIDLIDDQEYEQRYKAMSHIYETMKAN